jgi:hypothetical protein
MSLADPQTVTISGTPITLPRVSVGDDESEYSSGDGLTQMRVSHQQVKGGRIRRMARIDVSKMTSDPFRPSENVKVSMSNYNVFDVPPAGYTAAEAKAVWDGFIANLQASSGAAITKLLGGES